MIKAVVQFSWLMYQTGNVSVKGVWNYSSGDRGHVKGSVDTVSPPVLRFLFLFILMDVPGPRRLSVLAVADMDTVILPSRRKVHGISFWLSWECVLLPGRHLHVVTWGSMACRRQLTATAVESFLLSFLAHSQIDCAHSSYCLHSLQKRCVFNIKQYHETIIVTTAWGIVNTFIWFRGVMSFRARSGPSVREADTDY